jgi:DNA polymerase III delta subunit
MVKAKLTYYKKIFSDVDKKDIAALYLLRGPEYYIMEEMAARIVSSIVPDDLKSFNIDTSYGAEVDIGGFLMAARSFPFMADRRVLVLKELERFKGSWKSLLDYCEDPSPSSVLIMLFNPFDETGRRLRRPRDIQKLEELVRAKGRTLIFDKLTDADLIRWVVQKSARMNLRLEPEIAQVLVRSVGENLFDIQNELEKLALNFESAVVDRRALEMVIGSYRIDALFDLINSIRPGIDSRVLESLSRIITTGAERPSVVLYHAIRHFLGLLKIKAGHGGGSYRTARLKEQADRFRTRDILIWLENLRITEIMLKSVSFPEEMLLFGAFFHSMQRELVEGPAESFSMA